MNISWEIGTYMYHILKNSIKAFSVSPYIICKYRALLYFFLMKAELF